MNARQFNMLHQPDPKGLASTTVRREAHMCSYGAKRRSVNCLGEKP